MTGWTFTLGWTLLHALWQLTALALLVWLVLGLARRARPETRSLVASTGLVLMLVVPVATFVLLRRTEPASRLAGAPVLTLLEGGSRMPEWQPASRRQGSTQLRMSPAGIVHRVRTRLDGVAPWLVPLWALGVMVFGGRLLGGATWLMRARRRSLPEEGLWSQRLAILARHLGLRREVGLRILEELEGPVVAGLLKPVILVPASVLSGLPAHQVELLLAHELAHVLRHDLLASHIQRLVEVLLFFHPAVWWLGRRARQERERCCDALAADALGDPCGMAEALTSLEEMRLGGLMPAFSLGAASTGGRLRERVEALLGLEARPRKVKVAVAGVLVLTCVAMGAGLWKLRARRLSRITTQHAWTQRGNLSVQRCPDGVKVSFSLRGATAEEALAALAEAEAGCSDQEWATKQVNVPSLSGQPRERERITVNWHELPRAHFLEYFHRLKARTPLDCPPGIIVVRRDNLLLPWEPQDTPPLDIWVPKHVDEFNVEAARLVREAMLELKAKAPTPGVPQEARRRVPDALLAGMKSPDPGTPLLRVWDPGILEGYAQRAQEQPWTPTEQLVFGRSQVSVQNLEVAGLNGLKEREKALEDLDAQRPRKGRGTRTRRVWDPQMKTHVLKTEGVSTAELEAWRARRDRLEREVEAQRKEASGKVLQAALRVLEARLKDLPRPEGKVPFRAMRFRVQGAGGVVFPGMSLEPSILMREPGQEAVLLTQMVETLQRELGRKG